MASLDQQRPLRKKRRKKSTRAGQSRGSKAFYFVIDSLQSLVQVCYNTVRGHPRFSLGIAGFLTCAFALTFAVRTLKRAQEQILPESLVINTSMPELRQRIRVAAEKELAEARKLRLARSEFLRRMAVTLDGFESIDSFWLRAGLDGRLQITATRHVPIMVLEASGGERFLVSHQWKLMARNPPEALSASLLRLSAPEVKISWSGRRHETRSKDQRFTTVRFTPNANSVASAGVANNMNVAWLVRQSQRIQMALTTRKVGFALEKIVWRNTTGFTLVMKKSQATKPLQGLPPAPAGLSPSGTSPSGTSPSGTSPSGTSPSGTSPSGTTTSGAEQAEQEDGSQPGRQAALLPSSESISKPLSLTVVLGEAELIKKIDKLSEILEDLALRRLWPENVDLNFHDKAIIKLSESTLSPAL